MVTVYQITRYHVPGYFYINVYPLQKFKIKETNVRVPENGLISVQNYGIYIFFFQGKKHPKSTHCYRLLQIAELFDAPRLILFHKFLRIIIFVTITDLF
jgi:hypothetical protein